MRLRNVILVGLGSLTYGKIESGGQQSGAATPGLQSWLAVPPSFGPSPVQDIAVIDPDDIFTTEQGISRSPQIERRRNGHHSRAVVNTLDAQMKVHRDYGWATYGFWGIILLVGMANNLCSHLYNRRTSSDTSDVEGGNTAPAKTRANARKGPVNRTYNWWCAHVTVPGILPRRHKQLVWGCTIPTRLEGLVVGAFWILSIVLCAVNYGPFPKPIITVAASPPIFRHLATRTGTLCISNLPFIWAFGIRNNIFLWATGWQFSTFNLFHRHIARVSTIQAILHGICYTVTYLKNDPSGVVYRFTVKQRWFQLGITAVVSLSLLTFFSLSWFRRKGYELFLIIHIVLSTLVIAAVFYHRTTTPKKYEPYLWSLVALLVFDRTLRVVRLIYCNVHIALNKGKAIDQAGSTVRYDSEGDMLRIEVASMRSHPKPAPGQHYFLYQPGRLRFYESHPFTLAYWAEAPMQNLPSSATNPNDERAIGHQVNPPEKNCEAVGDSQRTTLVFMVRPRNGWTKRLRDKYMSSPENTITPTILVEGPYGRQEPLWAYEHVLIIVGGSGITAALPYLQDHIRRRASGAKCRTQRISLVWANRRENYMQAIARRELAGVGACSDIELAFYVTSEGCESVAGDGDSSRKKVDGVNEKEEIDAATRKHPPGYAPSRETPPTRLSVHYGRPDVGSIITRVALAAREEGSRAAVMTCGPASMADSVRAATVEAMKSCNPSIAYFEESFGW